MNKRTGGDSTGRKPACLRTLVRRLLQVGTLVGIFSLPSAHATSLSTYDFVEDGTGDVLLSMELSALPTDLSGIAGLNFSATGAAVFGFAAGPYSGTLDYLFGAPIDPIKSDGMDGLSCGPSFCSTIIEDADAPSSFVPFAPPWHFAITLGTHNQPDELQLHDDISFNVVSRTGNWQLAPEPSADFDNDGDVDHVDRTHPTLGWEERFGVDLDGFDLLRWQRQLGTEVPGLSTFSATVPEPTTSALALAATLLFAGGRRR